MLALGSRIYRRMGKTSLAGALISIFTPQNLDPDQKLSRSPSCMVRAVA
jgi:hypothetical protein